MLVNSREYGKLDELSASLRKMQRKSEKHSPNIYSFHKSISIMYSFTGFELIDLLIRSFFSMVGKKDWLAKESFIAVTLECFFLILRLFSKRAFLFIHKIDQSFQNLEFLKT